jgi:hypothetical protein
MVTCVPGHSSCTASAMTCAHRAGSAPARAGSVARDDRTLSASSVSIGSARIAQFAVERIATAFLASDLEGTLSMPWVPPGPHRPTRKKASHPPFQSPWRAIAS